MTALVASDRPWTLPGSRRSRTAVAAVVVAAVAVGVVQNHHGSGATHSTAATATVAKAPALSQQFRGAAADAPAASAAAGATTAATAGGDTAATAPGVDVGPQIVRTGTVSLTAPAATVPQVLTAVALVATKLQGSVADSSSSESGPAPSGSVTLRVPTARTDEAIRQLRTLGAGSTVTAVTTTSEDVTGQVVDVTARLKSLGESRDRYLDLLARTTSVGDTLSVQQRIDGVQTQIEQLQGQRNALADRTALSTLVVTVATKGSAAVTVPVARTGLSKSWHDARRHFGDGVKGLVAASGTTAFLLLCALGVWLLVLGGQRITRRRVAARD